MNLRMLKSKGLFITLFLTIVLIFLLRTFIFMPIIVKGESMQPTLHDGERVIVNKLSKYISNNNRSDLILFKKNKQFVIKRIVGVPGDSIYIQNNRLYINDQPLNEPYSIKWTAQKDVSLEVLYGVTEIPADYFFVLGDNRNNSSDSRKRAIGLVHKDSIVGKIYQFK